MRALWAEYTPWIDAASEAATGKVDTCDARRKVQVPDTRPVQWVSALKELIGTVPTAIVYVISVDGRGKKHRR